MKKRKAHLISLPRQAVDVLRAMHGLTGHRDHVFPNRDDRRKPMTDATLRQALKYLAGPANTARTPRAPPAAPASTKWLTRRTWIERQLAHVEQNTVRRTYNHADYLADRARMMQQWVDMLEVWKAGAEVLPLRDFGGVTHSAR